MSATPRQIRELLGNSVTLLELRRGGADLVLERAVALETMVDGCLSFLGTTASDPVALLRSALGGCLIVDRRLNLPTDALSAAPFQAALLVDNSRLAFIRAVKHFFSPGRPSGIDPSAVVAPSAALSDDVYIGALCTVGRDVVIGEGTVIHSGTHIRDRSVIGRRTTIESGCVIGSCGCGYERNERGDLELFPHLGRVVIGDDVDIGANTCVDRGALGDTVIEDGVKIDNLVHIAHNVVIGARSIVIAHAMIGGSTKIGSGCWVAPSAVIRDRIRIGNECMIGLGAIVTRNVPDKVTIIPAPSRDVGDMNRLLEHYAVLLAKIPPECDSGQ
jgi:UDP-3-O-[3-hydroxymyristoyl] glucosamine N-acyltransferase